MSFPAGSQVRALAKASMSSAGIGRASAERLIKAGCDIYFHYHSDESGPKALVALAHSVTGVENVIVTKLQRYREAAGREAALKALRSDRGG